MFTSLYRERSKYMSVRETDPSRHVYGLNPNKTTVKSDSNIPTHNPISIPTRITVRNVPIQTKASNLLKCQYFLKSITFMSIPFRETTIMLAKTLLMAKIINKKVIFNFKLAFQCYLWQWFKKRSNPH